MKIINGRWQGKKLRTFGFLSRHDLILFCEKHHIPLQELEIYEEEPKPSPPDEEQAEERPPLGDPPYGIWLNWPGLFHTDREDKPVSFPSLEAAEAWIEEQELNPDAVQVRSLPVHGSADEGGGA